jgi:hypothetical protein
MQCDIDDYFLATVTFFLKALLDLEGGVTATARGHKAMVERIDNRRGRRVEEFTQDAGLH